MNGPSPDLASGSEAEAQRRSPYRSDLTYPIGDGAADPFGHRDYVDSIESALREIPDQFTLGLFGPWGSGKSTVLDEVARRMNRAETVSRQDRMRKAMRECLRSPQTAWDRLKRGERRKSVLVT